MATANMFLVVLLVIALNLKENCCQYDCGPGCICFDDSLDCSRNDWTFVPDIEEDIILSTKTLYLRHMPLLDMNSFDCKYWYFLKTVDLIGSPLACLTWIQCPGVSVYGCEKITDRFISTSSEKTRSTTQRNIIELGETTTSTSTSKIWSTLTSNRIPVIVPTESRRQLRPIRTVKTSTTQSTVGTDANEVTSTTENANSGNSVGVNQDLVITLSTTLPASFGFLSGLFCYIQYRRRGGFRWGCIPGRNRGQKLKNSDESVNTTSSATQSEAPSTSSASAPVPSCSGEKSKEREKNEEERKWCRLGNLFNWSTNLPPPNSRKGPKTKKGAGAGAKIEMIGGATGDIERIEETEICEARSSSVLPQPSPLNIPPHPLGSNYTGPTTRQHTKKMKEIQGDLFAFSKEVTEENARKRKK